MGNQKGNHKGNQKFSKEEALFELRFWNQCMSDHSIIVHDSLGPAEGAYIQQTESLRQRFDDLLERSRRSLNDEQLGAVISESKQASEQLRDVKSDILKRHLVGKVETSLWPTFYAHAIDEVEEFLRILSYYLKGEAPPLVHPLAHDMLWLLDFSGHAQAMSDRLDYREEELKERHIEFIQGFAEFYIKAIDLQKYVRTGIYEFPALSKFHRDVEPELLKFQEFQKELEALRANEAVLGTLNPVFLDHMFREECYYHLKLSQAGEMSPPACDPTAPGTR